MIRKMIDADKNIVIDMMRRFYNSSAVITKGSEKIFAANVDACLKNSAYLEGYVFVVDEKIIGYGILAKSFSTEFGGECIWIEDIFIEKNFRGKGFGTRFLNFVKEKYPDKNLGLEVESDNVEAVAAYKKFGFKELPYLEMVLNYE
ncbi:MAG: GNAT family N-acetyltransferase [Selenomonadaceae bacterium]|nr:GNAT family N-acetyltransferase [Selenomonadaceae bacterium]